MGFGAGRVIAALIFRNSKCSADIVVHVLDGIKHRLDGCLGYLQTEESQGQDDMSNSIIAALGIVGHNHRTTSPAPDAIVGKVAVEAHFGSSVAFTAPIVVTSQDFPSRG